MIGSHCAAVEENGACPASAGWLASPTAMQKASVRNAANKLKVRRAVVGIFIRGLPSTRRIIYQVSSHFW
jgi:hypothetical protein